MANLIWQRIGDVDNAIEPFCFSAAWLLSRPHPPRIETLNDENCYVSNFWRATQHDPEAVAEFADSPVNEADLHARHRWLVLSATAADFRHRMRTDPDYFDARVAGYWCWGACCWIGSGWCATPQYDLSQQRPGLTEMAGVTAPLMFGHPPLPAAPEGEPGREKGLRQKIPDLSSGRASGFGCGVLGSHEGPGVHAKGLSQQMPDIGTGSHGGRNGRGVHGIVPSDSHRPQLVDGLSQKRPIITHAFSLGCGVHGNDAAGTCALRRAWLIDWFSRLRDRLRTVRVCCGDWRRVCDSESVTTRLGLTGIFLDPPYAKTKVDGSANRSADLYANDGSQNVDALVKDVRAYCLERGGDPRYRICLAGYEGEGHEELERHGWEAVAWKSSGGYGNRSANGKENAARERLWFSPHCIRPGGGARQGSLFD